MRVLLIHDGDDRLPGLVEPLARGLAEVELDHWDPALQGAPTRSLEWVHYDVVLLDARPGGADAIDWLRRWQSEDWVMPPVVLIGAADSVAERDRAIAAGAAEYLPQPAPPPARSTRPCARRSPIRSPSR